MDADDELLARIGRTENFFQSVLYKDTFSDWNLAREFGEFLVRILPNDIMGHAILVRAHRHLGNLELARDELKLCRTCTKTSELEQWEVDDFMPLLSREDRILSS